MGRRLFKELERSYGFDEVAIVPGEVTINPEMTSTKMNLGRQSVPLGIPNLLCVFRSRWRISIHHPMRVGILFHPPVQTVLQVVHPLQVHGRAGGDDIIRHITQREELVWPCL